MASEDWQASRVPISFDERAVKRIKLILERRKVTKPKKAAPVVPNVIINPSELDPIHLRTDSLPPLSPTTDLYCQRNGARNIAKDRRRVQENYKPIFCSQAPRSKSTFVEDSAIESDGEDGDIPSSATPPQRSAPTSPLHTLPPTPPRAEELSSISSIQLPVKKVKLKKPRKNSYCKDCNLFASGLLQLEIHLKSKKHLKQRHNSTSTHCTQSNRLFQSRHNLLNHKCEKFFKHYGH